MKIYTPRTWLKIFLLSLASVAGFFSITQEVNSQGTVDLAYTLRISDPASGKGHVKIDIKNLGNDGFCLREPNSDGTPIRVSGLIARDSFGNALEVNHLPDSEEIYHSGNLKDVWCLSPSTTGEVSVEYDVEPAAFLV